MTFFTRVYVVSRFTIHPKFYCKSVEFKVPAGALAGAFAPRLSLIYRRSNVQSMQMCE